MVPHSQDSRKLTALQRAAGQWLTGGRGGREVVGSAEALGGVAHAVVVLQADGAASGQHQLLHAF